MTQPNATPIDVTELADLDQRAQRTFDEANRVLTAHWEEHAAETGLDPDLVHARATPSSLSIEISDFIEVR